MRVEEERRTDVNIGEKRRDGNGREMGQLEDALAKVGVTPRRSSLDRRPRTFSSVDNRDCDEKRRRGRFCG